MNNVNRSLNDMENNVKFKYMKLKNKEEMIKFIKIRRNYRIMDFVIEGVDFED